MSNRIEQELSAAYEHLRATDEGGPVSLDGVRSAAAHRRRRTLAGSTAAGVCVGGMVLVTAVAVTGRDPQPTGPMPGAGAQTTAGTAAHSTTNTTAPKTTRSTTSASKDNNNDKGGVTLTPGARYPGDLSHEEVPPTVLPHDDQLPATAYYDTTYQGDHRTRTSRAYANPNNPPTVNVGSAANLEPDRPATKATHPALWAIWDTALNGKGDADPGQVSVVTAVSRFASPAEAVGAMNDMVAQRGPWLTYAGTRVAWAGADPSTHWLFVAPPGLGYHAVKAHGDFLLSASAATPEAAKALIVVLEQNLRTTGLER